MIRLKISIRGFTKALKQYTEANADLSEEKRLLSVMLCLPRGRFKKSRTIRLQLDAELDSNTLKKEA